MPLLGPPGSRQPAAARSSSLVLSAPLLPNADHLA